jgi:1-deoxy-D-xylulose-5-phosphate reductoisomerase
MKIPIFNSLYSSKKIINSKKLDLKKLNNLDFRYANLKKFPIIRILKMLPNNTSFFETILVSMNDKLVDLFLNNKIKFTDISKKMNKMLNLYSLQKYKKIKPKNIEEIIKMNTKIRSDIEYLIKK